MTSPTAPPPDDRHDHHDRHDQDHDLDVVVVGAGFSGLSAARHLVGAGRSVRVLEARDRVGGRTVNLPLGDGVITEGGGQYIGTTQDRLEDMAAHYGIATFPAYEEGSSTTWRGGQALPAPYVSTPDNDLPELIEKLQAIADEVPVAAPWTAERAAELDSRTVEEWIAAEAVTSSGADVLRSIVRILVGTEADEVSLLFLAYYIASAGNEHEKGTLVRLVSGAGGAQDRRFVGGSVRVAEAMAADLAERVTLSAPVQRIHWDETGVEVSTDVDTVRARAVVVAIPPPLAAELTFDPPLPPDQEHVLTGLRLGTLSKLQAVYEAPFWRSQGVSGNAMFADGPVQAIFENSPEDASCGVLFAFSGGAEAHRLAQLPEPERRDVVLEAFATVVGDRARHPERYLEVQWETERWSGGGPGPTARPGALTGFGGALREPVGPIFWAGTERAVYWTGYLEGAIRAGESAAERFIDSGR